MKISIMLFYKQEDRWLHDTICSPHCVACAQVTVIPLFLEQINEICLTVEQKPSGTCGGIC